LEATDVQTFVDLPAVGAHATETPGGPGFAGGADEEAFLAAGFVEGVIGGGKGKRLRA
jgi:hypothetical protein